MDKLKPGLTTITLLHYNRIRDLQLCLDSILKNTASPFEIILVDNGSTAPEAKDYVRSLKYVTLIDLPENIVPEAASAMSIPIASGEYIVGISDDIIVTPGWLERFLAHLAKQPHIGLIGPRSNFVSGPQMVPGIKYKDVWELAKFACEWSNRNTGRLRPYSRLVGFCWCCHRRVIDKIGYLDPSFGFGFSDDDFSIRVNLAGFKTAIAQDVFIHHTGGPQGKRESKHQKMLLEAWSQFKKKWGLPENMPLSQYHPKALLNRPFDPKRDYIPLPDPKEVEPYIYKRPGAKHFLLHKQYETGYVTQATVPAKGMARGLAAYYLGDLEKAVEIFQELAQSYAKSFEVNMAIGCTLAKSGRLQDAIAPLTAAMEIEPHSCKPGNALGRVLLSLGREDKAEEAFQKADWVSLYSQQAKFNLVRYYTAKGMNDQAIETARKAFERQPSNTAALTILGHLLISSRRYDEVVEYAERFLSLGGSHPNAFLLLFKAKWEKGLKPEALEVLKTMKALANKDQAFSRRIKALLEDRSDRTDKAHGLGALLKAAESLFDNLNWENDFSLDFLVKEDVLEELYFHAKSLYEENCSKEALALYHVLNRLAPDHASIHNDLGAIFWEQGDIDRALAHMYQAFNLDPADKDIVWNLGQALIALERTRDAIKVYQDYLKINPDDHEIGQEIDRFLSLTRSPEAPMIPPPSGENALNIVAPRHSKIERSCSQPKKDARIRFSIIIPTYNRPRLLMHTLESLKRQSYKDFKVYLFDNGSQPPVEVGKLPSDIDIEYSRVDKNIKAHSIVSEMISQIDSTHLVLFADDDVFLPHTLEIIAHIFREYAEVQLLSTGFSEFHHELCQPLTAFDRLQMFSGSLIQFEALKFAMKCCAIWGIGNNFEYHIPKSHPSASFLSMDVVRKTLMRQKQLLVKPFGDVGFLGCTLNSKYNHYLDLPLVVLGESGKKEMHGSKLGNRKYWDRYKNDLKFSPVKAVSFPNMELESHLKVLYLNGIHRSMDISIRPEWFFSHMRHIIADDPWTNETERDLTEAIPLTIDSLIKYHGVSRQEAQAYVENWIQEQKAKLAAVNKKDDKESKQPACKSFTREFKDINDFAKWQEETFVIPKFEKLYGKGTGSHLSALNMGSDMPKAYTEVKSVAG